MTRRAEVAGVAAVTGAAMLVVLAMLAVGTTHAPAEELGGEWGDERATAGVQDAASSAIAENDAATLIAIGEDLFKAKFTTEDGAGRPMATQAIIPTERRRPAPAAFRRSSGPDANSCAGCHNDPVAGAAGDFAVNVFVSEGFNNADFDSLDPQFSNERGTTALQGAGLVELLAREMSRDLQAQRSAALADARATETPVRISLETKGVTFGQLTANPDGTVDLSQIEGVDPDLVIRPFSQKGVMTSLRQFTVNALNHHHGIQPVERFGIRWTGKPDFDQDGIANEMDVAAVSALVAFQAALPPPGRAADMPDDWRAAAASGEALFGEIGCAACHRPALPLEDTTFHDPGPLDAAGTLRAGEARETSVYDLARLPGFETLERNADGHILVPLFGDLKRHVIADARHDRLGNELLAQRFVERNIFMTAELWGVGSTAPYGHRGDITTLRAMIIAHGGDAGASREAFEALQPGERNAIIGFLRTLTISDNR
ncbi:MAG: di-heme oxidoredictase family protein, partial [Pseudomonadota bacterium]